MKKLLILLFFFIAIKANSQCSTTGLTNQPQAWRFFKHTAFDDRVCFGDSIVNARLAGNGVGCVVATNTGVFNFMALSSISPWARGADTSTIHNTNSGNVGIGTATPTEKLELTGGYYQSVGYGNDTRVGFGVGMSSSHTPQPITGFFSIIGIDTVTGNRTDFRLDNIGVASQGRVMFNNTMLVNTGNDGQAFQFNAIATVNSMQLAIDTDFLKIGGGGGGGNTLFNISFDSTAYFSGNVGIGTSSPTYKLQVRSDLGVSFEDMTGSNAVTLTPQQNFIASIDDYSGNTGLLRLTQEEFKIELTGSSGKNSITQVCDSVQLLSTDVNHTLVNKWDAVDSTFRIESPTNDALTIDNLFILPNLITEADTAGKPTGTLYRDGITNAVFWKP